MKTDHWFLNNNLLDLNITHCDYGSFDDLLHSNDMIPYNRLFIIPSTCKCKNSYICHRLENKKKHFLKPGNIYFIPSNFDLEYAFYKELKLIGIHFSLELFSGLDLFTNETQMLSLEDSSKTGDTIWQDLGCSDSIKKIVNLRANILLLTGLFIRKTTDEIKSMKNIGDKYSLVFNWIRDNIKAGISISKMANIAGLSVDTFSRNFSRDLGLSIKQHLNQELVKEASRRLIYSDKKSKEIAMDLEFNDEYYFSRFFKKQTGLSPVEYRYRYSRGRS
ncbi:MAG: AraC family transcriptional regulator [Spirochaetaceae bacterium]